MSLATIVLTTQQLEVKRTALAESVRHVNNLDRANHTHLQKYAEMTKKNEALEKRYTQAMHTQTLTQQSLTHVRSELTTLRATSTRQNIALASGVGVEERLAEVERRYEEARESAEVESRKAREETRKRKRAEERIGVLEEHVRSANKEVDDIKEARGNDAQELLANAKERLEILHQELSQTFHAESPGEAPEYQRALESLVANNALLKHDVSELTHALAETREENRAYREEIDELRAAIGVAGRDTPSVQPRALSTELNPSRSHSRTESSPVITNANWNRIHHRNGSVSPWEHHRKVSLAPSFASTSTMEGITSTLGPGGLGMGPIGEFGGPLREEALSPTSDGRSSPKPTYRTSPSGGIGYHLNGVPKTKTTSAGFTKPFARRSLSSDKPRPAIRSFAVSSLFALGRDGFLMWKQSQGVESIAEWGPADDEQGNTTEEPLSPGGSEYFRNVERSRKRASLILARRETMSPTNSFDYSTTVVDQSSMAGYPSPMSDSAIGSQREKRVNKRTLLLLSRSRGVQTDPPEIDAAPSKPASISTGTSPQPPDERSETSSVHENRVGPISVLVEHLSKILTRLHSADVRTLNKRLKKQHLPGDVGHLSKSTMRTLSVEISDLRQHFRGLIDIGGNISKKDFVLLLKLFKDVFHQMIELQNILNDVTIDPSLAKKLQKDAYREEEDENRAKQSGGLGWIAAPITKFFVTPALESDAEATVSPRPGRGLERGRLQPLVRPAPKIQASTSATTTHVSVEFGGTGIIRRATPSVPAPTTVIEGLPPSPHDTMRPSTSQDGLAPPLPRTLRTSKSRANRNELLGIFAGAPKVPSPTDPWVMLPPSDLGAVGERLRTASSQHFGDKTVRQPRDILNQRKRLSAVVDAVIDSTRQQLEADEAPFDPFAQAPLLERTLRPRGLSDSSIRSTFVSHAHSHPQVSIVPERKGVLESLSRRFYGWKGTEVSPVNPDPGESTPTTTKETPVPIAIARSISPPPAQALSLASSQTGTGIMGILGSLAGNQNQDREAMNENEEEEDELAGAMLRQGAVGGRPGKSWR
ncbi:hypothetical protein P7C73_g4812, partial [Tremellales sp. Uapishka_1]